MNSTTSQPNETIHNYKTQSTGTKSVIVQQHPYRA